MKTRTLFLLLCAAFCLAACAPAATPTAAPTVAPMPTPTPAPFQHEGMESFPARLHVQGNQILDESGQVVVFKGLMAPDLARLDEKGRFKREFFAEMAATGANVIRVPVHPDYWIDHRTYLTRYLDPVVGWAGELGMYVIIDWHYIGNIHTGAGAFMPEVGVPPMEMSLRFWKLIAGHYRDAPHVIFEVFNEPQAVTEEEWFPAAEELLSVIRAEGATQLALVAGIDYGKDLTRILEAPIQDDNVAYVAHIYASHSKILWDTWFGEVAKQHPLVVTEWGFMEQPAEGHREADYLVGTVEQYAQPLMDYLAAHGAGWVACWYDDEWFPSMFNADDWTLNGYGEYVLELWKGE